jgi:hypothetical protein
MSIPNSVLIKKTSSTLSDLNISDDSIKYITNFANNKLKEVCSQSIKQLTEELFIDTIKPVIIKIENNKEFYMFDNENISENTKWEERKQNYRGIALLKGEKIAYITSSNNNVIGLSTYGRTFNTNLNRDAPPNLLEGEPFPLSREYIDILNTFANEHYMCDTLLYPRKKMLQEIVEVYKKYHPIASDISHNEDILKKINEEQKKLDNNKNTMENFEKELELRNTNIIKEEQLLKDRILNVAKREVELEIISNITKRELDLNIKENEFKILAQHLLNTIDTAECELGINNTSLSRTSIKKILLNLETKILDPPSYKESCN